MRWMIKNATVMTQDDQDRWLENSDIVVSEGRIIAIGEKFPPESFGVEKIVSGQNKLVIPGLVNAHHHSHDRFDKGRFDNLPFEPWVVLYNPPIGRRDWTPRECYLCAVLNCIEMLKAGTTTVIDDINYGIPLSQENIEAVFQAYQDIGMRALLSIYYSDRPYYRTIAYLEDLLPGSLKKEMDQSGTFTQDDIIKLWRSYGQQWRGRVKFILSPSAPQRCTDEFLRRTWSLSEELNLPVTLHVLETKVQAVTGQLFYGKSIVEYMSSLGILTSKTTLAHVVWVTDRDIKLISEAGASVAHNPIANLKLGSGIAPVRKMIDAGIKIGLGTDNNNGNDTNNLFETMRVAALLHKVVDSDYDQWVGAKEVMKMVTRGGAACSGLNGEIGTLSVGMKADMVLLDLRKLSFLPRNNLLHQLVFSEHGESVDSVVVDGKLVVEAGTVTAVNEQKIIDEVMERAEEIQGKIRRASIRGGEIEPYVREAYFRCVHHDIGFSAYSKS